MQKVKIKKAYVLLGTIILVCSTLFLGCGASDSNVSGAVLYYTNSTMTGLEKESYSFHYEDSQQQVGELVDAIQSEQATTKLQPVLQDDVELEDGIYDNHQVYLYFNEAYSDLDPTQEILLRAAVVKTFLQVEDVTGVSFFVDNKPLENSANEKVGIMTKTTFTNDLGNQEDASTRENLTLYFASSDGEKLIPEARTVTVKSNMSTAYKVVEELLKGPKESGAKRTLQSDITINKVAVMGGVCYVNFGSEFENQTYDVDAKVIIYSIVNSLAELPNINSVQISVNGNTDILYRKEVSLQTFFEKNTHLIQATSKADS